MTERWQERLIEDCERDSREEKRDREGKTAEERFAAIREFFLEQLRQSGHARRELYKYPKPGAREAETEVDVVLQWASATAVRLNDILFGIQRAFELAAERGDVVTSFRYCVPQITNCATEAARRDCSKGGCF